MWQLQIVDRGSGEPVNRGAVFLGIREQSDCKPHQLSLRQPFRVSRWAGQVVEERAITLPRW